MCSDQCIVSAECQFVVTEVTSGCHDGTQGVSQGKGPLGDKGAARSTLGVMNCTGELGPDKAEEGHEVSRGQTVYFHTAVWDVEFWRPLVGSMRDVQGTV